jgi:hypothetical protein
MKLYLYSRALASLLLAFGLVAPSPSEAVFAERRRLAGRAPPPLPRATRSPPWRAAPACRAPPVGAPACSAAALAPVI